MHTLSWIIVLIPFVITALILFFIRWSVNRNGGTYWRKQKVFNIITSHRVFTIAEISKLSGIREKQLIPTLRYIVSEANTSQQGIDLSGLGFSVQVHTSSLGDVGFLRGSCLDLNKMEIVLAENSLAKPANTEWVCLYCSSKNPGMAFDCGGCGARRQG